MNKYRAEIDGLRGIAVLAVVFYHAKFDFSIFNYKFQIFPGGFFGVDIFFVISGFLITKVIINNFDNNNFKFSNFYERRIRRIIPALFFIVLSSFLLGWLLLTPDDYKNFSKSSLYLLFFTSNLWFFLNGSYLDGPSELMPLLHTWSLSVEEQFYIFFPALLIFLYKINKYYIFLSILILISFLFSIFGSYKFFDLNFYFIISRIWELLIGSITFFLSRFLISKKISRINYNFILMVSLFFLFFSIIFFDDKIKHPSYFTLIPVLSVALIILFSKDGTIVINFLKSKILVYLGLISYSFYLWHFPLLAFNRVKSAPLSNFDKFETLLLSVFLSILTYFFIEKPFRNFKIIKTKLFFSIIIISFFTIFTLSNLVIITKGFPQRYSKELVGIINYDATLEKKRFKDYCFVERKDIKKINPFKNCKDKISFEKKNIILWGDSLAAHLIPGLKEVLDNNFNLIVRASAGCPPIIDDNTLCQSINNKVYNELKSNEFDYLIISGSWEKHNLGQLDKSLSKLKKTNIKNIILVGPSYKWSKPLKNLIIKYYRINRTVPYQLGDKRIEYFFKLDDDFKEISLKHNIKYISPMISFCSEEKLKCKTKVNEENNILTHWDENHYTKEASKYLIRKYKNFFN